MTNGPLMLEDVYASSDVNIEHHDHNNTYSICFSVHLKNGAFQLVYSSRNELMYLIF